MVYIELFDLNQLEWWFQQNFILNCSHSLNFNRGNHFEINLCLKRKLLITNQIKIKILNRGYGNDPKRLMLVIWIAKRDPSGLTISNKQTN